jgi:Glycosyl transferase family 2
VDVHVVTATYGNYPVVRECVESWLPLPVGWKLWVYDSKVSAFDGTKDYVRGVCERAKGTYIDDGRNRLHPSAIEEVLKHIRSGWMLLLDSDAKLVDRSFYDWVNNKIADSGNKMWGHVARCEPRIIKDHRGYRLVLPRAFAWLVLIECEFIVRHRLSFDAVEIRGKRISGSLPGTLVPELASGQQDVHVFGDTGWQVLWKALGMGVFGEMPERIWRCWEHRGAASRCWRETNEAQLKQRGLT